MLNHDEKAIEIMKDFVEGKIDIKTFKYEFDSNDMLRETLENDMLCPKDTNYLLPEDKNIIRYLEMKNWLKTGDQYGIWGEIKRFLSRYNYLFEPTKNYEDRYGFLLEIQPSWLDVLDEDFLNEQVISKVPDDLTKSQRVAWCKTRLKELFRCEKSWPRWIQNPDWPIINGIPLVFKKQIRDKKDEERVDFIFYNAGTGEEHIITQWL